MAAQRVPGLRLALALERTGRAAIEARISSTLLFALRGTSEDAALMLFQDRRFVTAPVRELLEALVGLAVGPERLLAVLTGCVSFGPSVSADDLGRVARLRTGDADVYLEGRKGQWTVRAGTFDGVMVDYTYERDSWPSRVHLASEAGATRGFDLVLTVRSFDSTPREPGVFRPRVPQEFERVSVDWVRQNGPLQR